MRLLSASDWCRKCAFLVGMCGLIYPGQFVYAGPDNHTDVWTSMSYYHHLPNSRINLFVNPQLRFTDNRYKLKQINMYLALSYHASQNLEVLFGAYRDYLQKENGSVSGENRWWQQASADLYEKSGVDISSRSRLEERISNGNSAYANRFRQLFSIQVPFIRDLRLIIGNEFFLQLNQPQWVSQRVYSQNRFNIGVRHEVDGIAFEIGYLNQYIFNKTDVLANVLYFNVAYSSKYSHTIRDILLES